MNQIQGRSLCSLLTIVVVLLFVMVLYRVYQYLEKFEEEMSGQRNKISETEETIINSIKEVLKPEDVRHIESLKDELETVQSKKVLISSSNAMRAEKEAFALREEEAFHTGMVHELEGFDNHNMKAKMQTKIDRMQELLKEIESKSSMSLQSPGDVFTATIKLGTTSDAKRVKLLLQEYTIEGNPTGLYIIPETKLNKYTLMCVKTVKDDSNEFSIQLEECNFQKDMDVKPFLYSLNPVTDADGKEVAKTIQPYLATLAKESVSLVAEKDASTDGHTIKLVKGDITPLQFNRFTLVKV